MKCIQTTGDKKLKKFKEMFEDDESDSEKSTSKERTAVSFALTKQKATTKWALDKLPQPH